MHLRALAEPPAVEKAAPDSHSNSRAIGRATVADPWIDLISPSGPVGIQGLGNGVTHCGDVKLSDKPGELIASSGSGVVAAISKRGGSGATNLISNKCFEDCEVRLEFLMGENSNSGVKLQQRYEIQLYDSYGRDKPTARDCGGIYPHWVFRIDRKGLNYLDEGIPPIANAAKAAGKWQTLCIVFRAPHFDSEGKKIRNAKFESVVLNGQVVQRNVELDSPTGNASAPLAETPRAKLLLQMDHGAVAFRNVRVRPL
jgi:hypothetical protein